MNKHVKNAFTLIEIMIVVAIVAILILATVTSLAQDRQKAADVKVKTDLARLKIAFEDYYNDNHCYPPPTWFDGPEDCNSSELMPYLAAIPCDSRTGKPYKLETDATGCGSFKLYGQLIFAATDPQALAQCSPGGSNLGNYGVSSSNVSVQVACISASPVSSVVPSPSPSPVSSSTPAPSGSAKPSLPPVDPAYTYYCSGIKNCTSYDPQKFYCTPAFTDPNCGGDCESASACVLR